MKVVGLFRELGRGIDKSVQSINEAAGRLPMDTAVLVAQYLRSGVPVFDVMETTIDPFDKSVRIDGGPSLISDGEWVWRDDLAYFVEKYKISLPDEFLAHALERRRVNEVSASVVARWEEAVSAYDLAERGGAAIPVKIEVLDEGRSVVCKDTVGNVLWGASHPAIQEWREHRNYGNGRYTEQDLASGVFLGGCIKDGFAIITFALRSQLMVNISYVAMTGKLDDIHEAR